MEKLIKIQSELKAPKSNYNGFGKFHYRSCEDILEAVKPLLAKEKCTLTLSDDIVAIADKVYVRATATISDGKEQHSTSAYARESENKKGMDESQMTGTASSYARKYALNGLFLIDDTKDADIDEFQHTKQKAEKKQSGATKKTEDKKKADWRTKVLDLAKSKGITAIDLATKYKLNNSTSAERFKEIYEELTVEKGEKNAECNS
jgi:hypothetical protein